MQLVNEHIPRYYELGFDSTKALALFENAKKIPVKREELLFDAVQYSPEESILSYIFINYPGEKKNVYKIAQLFEMDFGKYIEESFSNSYTESVKQDIQKVEKLKEDIVRTMKEFGIKSSATLMQINREALVIIVEKYKTIPGDVVNEEVLIEFSEYDAPNEEKAKVIKEFGIWDLAKKYSVSYTADEKEQILGRYYSDEAKNNEEAALEVKEKLREVMKALSVNESTIFDQLEKDCIKRFCGNIDAANETQCTLLKQKVADYSALDKNKQEFFEAIQTRIETIGSKEDDEIFDNVYMNTNIYNQVQINEAIQFIKQKGRTASSQKYITALESCNPKNIKKAKRYQKKRAKVFNAIGTILLLLGIVCMFVATPVAVIAIPGIIMMISYSSKRKMWKILTIDETQIHSMLMTDKSINDMNVARKAFEEQETLRKKTKTANTFALISMICGIATIPLAFSVFFWLPAWICSIVLGIIALAQKTRKKGFAIMGLVFSVLFLIR